MTINNFGPKLGADSVVGVLELGGAYLPNGEDKRYASTASLLNLEAPYSSSVPAEGPSNDYLVIRLIFLTKNENHRHNNWGNSGMVYWNINTLKKFK